VNSINQDPIAYATRAPVYEVSVIHKLETLLLHTGKAAYLSHLIFILIQRWGNKVVRNGMGGWLQRLLR
jgi:hypothetical protein